MQYVWKDSVCDSTFHVGWKVGGKIYHAFSVSDEFLRNMLDNEEFEVIDNLPVGETMEIRFSMKMIGEPAPW